MRSLLSLSAIAFAFVFVANTGCAPKDKHATPQANETLGPIISGGGGNGINGRPIETYSVPIETLSEYKLYVAPVLKRMTRESSDALAAYLNWAVRGKVWYFVPVELSKLPKERTALAFQSDQLALHAEKEIFISSHHYGKKTRKERASLLLHELVMAARLLALKSPKAQCETLNSHSIHACNDVAVLKLAQTAPQNESNTKLDGEDHESIRALTVFLMDEDSDLSAKSVLAARRRFQFPLPWDQVLSDLNMTAVHDALRRASLSGEVFHAVESLEVPLTPVKTPQGNPAECIYQFDNLLVSSVGFPSYISVHYSVPANSTETTASRVQLNWGGQISDRYTFKDTTASLSSPQFEARGDFLPGSESRVVDHVTLSPTFSTITDEIGVERLQVKDGHATQVVELYLTRESTSRLLELRVVPKRVMLRLNTRPGEPKYELVPARDLPAFRCINETGLP